MPNKISSVEAVQPVIAALEALGLHTAAAAVQRVQVDCDAWHKVVRDCEEVLGLVGTAESPLMSNLVNICRDRMHETRQLTEDLQKVNDLLKQLERPETSDKASKVTATEKRILVNKYPGQQALFHHLYPTPCCSNLVCQNRQMMVKGNYAVNKLMYVCPNCQRHLLITLTWISGDNPSDVGTDPDQATLDAMDAQE